MQLHALHHVTMLTGDASATVAFYSDLLGLRSLDEPDEPAADRLSFGDAAGTPGSILTWVVAPGAPRGTPGAGMIHRLQLGVDGEAALTFWKDRLEAAGHPCGEADGVLRFADHEGLDLELHADTHGNPPLTARHPEVPPEFALTGVQGARAYAAEPAGDHGLLTQTLGFDHKRDHEYVLGAGDRHVHWGYDERAEPGREGAGTVRHIAWHAQREDLRSWQARVEATETEGDAVFLRTPQGVAFALAAEVSGRSRPPWA